MPSHFTAKQIDLVKIEKKLADKLTDRELFSAIVNSPFDYPYATGLLSLGIIVLLLVDKQKRVINRVALSNTEPAEGTLAMTAKRFEDIAIPLNYKGNIIAEAIRTGQPQQTKDWPNLFAPALTPEEARFNQAGGAISYSAVYPLNARDGGAIIFSYHQYPSSLDPAYHQFMQAYAELVSRALRSLG
jgi:hypothetical protein